MKSIQDIDQLLKKVEVADVECQWPQEVFDIPDQEVYKRSIRIPIKANVLPDGCFKVLRVSLTDSVQEVMHAVAKEFGKTLLPPESDQPLDQLFCHGRDDELAGPIEDLAQPIWKVILRHRTRKFGLKLLLVIKVNSSWKVAPKISMSPRDILDLFGMDHTQYTLYAEKGTDPLPLDTPIDLERGDCFVAIKDGKYGGN